MYDRQISGDQALTFGVSGMLYQNGLIMYDHQTESLWSHILGQAISGDFKGTHLTFIPVLHTTWKSWEKVHPDTLVVSPDLYGADPYTKYYYSPAEGIKHTLNGGPSRDEKIYPKQFVIGVRLAGQAKAYPFSALHKQPVINDRMGSIPIAIFFNKLTLTGTVFYRRLDDGTFLTFAPTDVDEQVIDAQTQSTWNALTGQAVSGPLKGTTLAQIPITYAFWFGWVDNHPGNTIYSPPQCRLFTLGESLVS